MRRHCGRVAVVTGFPDDVRDLYILPVSLGESSSAVFGNESRNCQYPRARAVVRVFMHMRFTYTAVWVVTIPNLAGIIQRDVVLIDVIIEFLFEDLS